MRDGYLQQSGVPRGSRLAKCERLKIRCRDLIGRCECVRAGVKCGRNSKSPFGIQFFLDLSVSKFTVLLLRAPKHFPVSKLFAIASSQLELKFRH